MTPREFEEYVCSYYREHGYKAEVTSYGGDFGVDVFAEKGGKKIAIQAKMYGGTTRKVNRQTIMELYGAAAYFDCSEAVLATDGVVMADAVEVADKLGVVIKYFNAGNGLLSLGYKSDGSQTAKSLLAIKRNAGKDKAGYNFDVLWQKYIMPLEGKTLTRPNGDSNVIVKVDWAGIERITSNGRRQRIRIEIFKYAVDKLLSEGYVSRDEINQNYTGRASSGIVLILSQVPCFEAVSRPSGLKFLSK